MSDQPTEQTGEEMRDHLAEDAAENLAAALRNLLRLHDGDEEALGQAIGPIIGAASDPADEPIVIKVESLGAIALITLREYISQYHLDREAGLDRAREVLDLAPRPFIHNRDDAIDHPELLQLHTAIDRQLLGVEIGRLATEGSWPRVEPRRIGS